MTTENQFSTRNIQARFGTESSFNYCIKKLQLFTTMKLKGVIYR